MYLSRSACVVFLVFLSHAAFAANCQFRDQRQQQQCIQQEQAQQQAQQRQAQLLQQQAAQRQQQLQQQQALQRQQEQQAQQRAQEQARQVEAQRQQLAAQKQAEAQRQKAQEAQRQQQLQQQQALQRQQAQQQPKPALTTAKPNATPTPVTSPTAGMTPVVLGNGQRIFVNSQGSFFDANGNPISNQSVANAKKGTPAIAPQPTPQVVPSNPVPTEAVGSTNSRTQEQARHTEAQRQQPPEAQRQPQQALQRQQVQQPPKPALTTTKPTAPSLPVVSRTAGLTPVTLGNGQQVLVNAQGAFFDANGNPISNQSVAAATKGTPAIIPTPAPQAPPPKPAPTVTPTATVGSVSARTQASNTGPNRNSQQTNTQNQTAKSLAGPSMSTQQTTPQVVPAPTGTTGAVIGSAANRALSATTTSSANTALTTPQQIPSNPNAGIPIAGTFGSASPRTSLTDSNSGKPVSSPTQTQTAKSTVPTQINSQANVARGTTVSSTTNKTLSSSSQDAGASKSRIGDTSFLGAVAPSAAVLPMGQASLQTANSTPATNITGSKAINNSGAQNKPQVATTSSTGLTLDDRRWMQTLTPSLQSQLASVPPETIARIKANGSWDQVKSTFNTASNEITSNELQLARDQEKIWSDAWVKTKRTIGTGANVLMLTTGVGELAGGVKALLEARRLYVAARATGAGTTVVASDLLQGGQTFGSFNAFKRAFGPAGTGKEWHHIVEQSKENIFGTNVVQTTKNIVKMPKEIHDRISAYYSTKQAFTNGQTVRQWLNDKSFEENFRFGVDVAKRFGGL